MPLNKILKSCKKILSHYYGNRLQGIVLYGSSARKTSMRESDIDFLVLLKRPVDYFVELRILTDLLYPIQLECDRLISAKPVDAIEFETGQIQLYRNAKKEGLLI
ncbi:MAG: nucleotidyltransferase domain-containing protein [Candidatus Omnitrophica bacterium]|nr:nucleotidyltransferase domain-containing protein [Candidatus Omnitrophota bacterium]